MPPIRVLVSEPNRILREILFETLREASDLSVELVGEESVLDLADARDADVAILPGEDHGLSPLGHELLLRRPRMHVLTIWADEREAFLYQLRPVERPLGEISPRTLLQAVRAAADRPS